MEEKENINIEIDNNSSKEIEEFEKNEWIISGIEHYWKKRYRFYKKKM